MVINVVAQRFFILALTLIVAAWTTTTSSHDSFTRLSLGSHPACLLLFIALPSLAQGVRPQLFTRTLCVWKAKTTRRRKKAPKTTRRRKKALGCGHAPSRKRQMFYPAPDTGSPAYLRSCPSATVRKCEAKRRQFGRAISEAIKVNRTTPPLWGPLPGAIVSIIRSVCSALLRARSDQTPPAVGQGTIARPS